MTPVTDVIHDIKAKALRRIDEAPRMSISELSDIHTELLTEILSYVEGCAGCLVILDQEDKAFDRVYSVGYGEHFLWWNEVRTGDGLVSEVIATGAPVIVDNVTVAEHFKRLCQLTVSQITLPIFTIIGGLYGILALEFSSKIGKDTKDHVLALAEPLSDLITRIESMQYNKRFALLISRLDNISRIPEDPLVESNTIVSALIEVVGDGEVALLLRRAGNLDVIASANIPVERLPHELQIGISVGAGYTCWVAHKRESFYCKNTANPAYEYYRIVDPKTKSQYTTPIIFQNELLGVINVGAHSPYSFSERDRALIDIVAQHAASFLYYRRMVTEIITLTHKAKQKLDFTDFISSTFSTVPPEKKKLLIDSMAEARNIVAEAEYPFRYRSAELVDLNSLTAQALDRLMPLAAAHDITMSVVTNKFQHIPYEISVRHFEDIADNLILNALESAKHQAHRYVNVGIDNKLLHTVNYVCFEVRNSGRFSSFRPEAGSEALGQLLSPGEFFPRSILGLHDTLPPQGIGLWVIDRLLASYGGYLDINEHPSGEVQTRAFFRL